MSLKAVRQILSSSGHQARSERGVLKTLLPQGRSRSHLPGLDYQVLSFRYPDAILSRASVSKCLSPFGRFPAQLCIGLSGPRLQGRRTVVCAPDAPGTLSGRREDREFDEQGNLRTGKRRGSSGKHRAIWRLKVPHDEWGAGSTSRKGAR